MTDVCGANTFPMRKYNSRAFHLKVHRLHLVRFFRRFPQINVGGDSARIPFMEHASRESRVALPSKGWLRQLCFKHVPEQIRKKLDDKAEPMILIGYHPTSAYGRRSESAPNRSSSIKR